MPLFFTAFVYIPFGNLLVPFLEFWRATAQTITLGKKEIAAQEFLINPSRISKQMFYFTVTAQLVNFATEVVLPYVKVKVFRKVQEVKNGMGGDDHLPKDHEEEAAFLDRVRNEMQLADYDVTADYREMVIQFGKHIIAQTPGFHCGMATNPSRVHFPIFSSLALGSLLFLDQQLGRAPIRCFENCH